MTDNSPIPRRLEGEYENILGFNTLNTGTTASPHDTDFSESGVNAADGVSMEALINVLIKRGLFTESELLAEENRLQARRETASPLNFTPVQIQRESYEHKRYDNNRLRRWAAKRQWSRKLGTLLFGWKWHRKKRDQQV